MAKVRPDDEVDVVNVPTPVVVMVMSPSGEALSVGLLICSSSP